MDVAIIIVLVINLVLTVFLLFKKNSTDSKNDLEQLKNEFSRLNADEFS